jgi:RNA polymerase sigma factor (sigma-70 family)
MGKLAEGDSHAAWDLFVERYRRLMLASIRRLIREHDDVMDVFASVCEALVADDLARLRRYADRIPHETSAASWLVAVVRNLTVDWLRQRDGRRRLTVPAHLPPLHAAIYTAMCVGGHSAVEAYEMLHARRATAMPYREFLREVRATQRAAPCPDRVPRPQTAPEQHVEEIGVFAADPLETAESARRLAAALATQPSDVRLAVELYIVDGMAAADVARVVGWANAKAVYNRVYRALAALRAVLERAGIGPGDL